MDPDHRYWNREELYAEVWSTPMCTLAKKYGISDVALAKTCRKLNVPLPGRGYWAKKQAGQKLKQPPLPSATGTRLIAKPSAPKLNSPMAEPGTAEELEQLAHIEARLGNVEPKRGSLSHPLILQARAVLSKARVDDRGILWTRDQCLDIRVSKTSLDRAIRIMASLIQIMEDEGFQVAISKVSREHENASREHTMVTIFGQVVRFGIIERAVRVVPADVAPAGLDSQVRKTSMMGSARNWAPCAMRSSTRSRRLTATARARALSLTERSGSITFRSRDCLCQWCDRSQRCGKGAALTRLAAEQGYSHSQSALAGLYSDGEGVPKDLVEVHQWASRAAATGDSIYLKSWR